MKRLNKRKKLKKRNLLNKRVVNSSKILKMKRAKSLLNRMIKGKVKPNKNQIKQEES